MSLAVSAGCVVFALGFFLEHSVYSKVKALKSTEHDLSREAAHYRHAAQRLSNPATFLNAAKLNRKAIVLEGDCESIRSQQDALKHSRAIRAVQAAKLFICLLTVICFWQQPPFQLHPSLLWPLGHWLSFPPGNALGSMGAITILPWLSLSNRASTAIVAGLMRFKQRLLS